MRLRLSSVLLFIPAFMLADAYAHVPVFTRYDDVIYGRKSGATLTMDVFTPELNRLGVILVVSGGWFSADEVIHPPFFADLTKRGYTAFAVVHGSQPKFTIPEIISDMHRAARYIQRHASEYKLRKKLHTVVGDCGKGFALSQEYGALGQGGCMREVSSCGFHAGIAIAHDYLRVEREFGQCQ